LDGARTRYLVAGQLLLSLLFAGLEKIAAGWPFSNPMAVLLKSPPHFIMRGPLAGLGDPGASIAGMVLGVCTLALELSIPILALFRRTRTLAAVAMAGFFVVVIASMQVPPLFFCIYFGGALLILDDARYLQVIGNRGGSEFNSASPDRQSRG
jgi:hypothetical protein